MERALFMACTCAGGHNTTSDTGRQAGKAGIGARQAAKQTAVAVAPDTSAPLSGRGSEPLLQQSAASGAQSKGASSTCF